MESHVLLVSAQGSPADVEATVQAIASTQLSVSGPHSARLQHLPSDADSAVLVGPAMDVPLLDALRHLTSWSIPTLVLVRGLTEQQETSLLSLGANDVVGLPSSASRLSSRISALHRNQASRVRPTGPPEAVIELSLGVVLWPERRQLCVNDTVVRTTKSEFDLLLIIARHPGRVISRGQLETEMSNGASGARAIESHISRLRGKVSAHGGPRLIESARGVGYYIRTDVSTASTITQATGD